MFSLVQYHNDTYCVVPSNKVHKLNKKECLVKCKGAKYAAFIVSQNDCKSDLLDLKHKKENKIARTSTLPKYSRSSNRQANELAPIVVVHSQPLPVNQETSFFISHMSTTEPVEIKNDHDFVAGSSNIHNSTEISPLKLEAIANEICNSSLLLTPNNNTNNKYNSTEISPLKMEAITDEIDKSSLPTVPDKTSSKQISEICHEISSETYTDTTEIITSRLRDSVLSSSEKIHKHCTEISPLKMEAITDEVDKSTLPSAIDKTSSKQISEICHEISSETQTDTTQIITSLLRDSVLSSSEKIHKHCTEISPLKMEAITDEVDKSTLPSAIDKTSSKQISEICHEISSETQTDITQIITSLLRDSVLSSSEINNKHSTEISPLTVEALDNKIEVSLSLSADDKTISNKHNSTEISPSKIDGLSHEIDDNSWPMIAEMALDQITQLWHETNPEIHTSDTTEVTSSLLQNTLESEYVPTSETSNIQHEISSAIQTSVVTETTSTLLQETLESEYFPNSEIESIDMTNEQNDSTCKTIEPNDSTCKIEDKSIEVIKNTLNISSITVPHRSKILKKHFCVFCKTLQCKIARHFFLVHKSVKEIRHAANLPIKCKERLDIISELRKKGDFLHNTTDGLNTGILIVSRQQQTNSKNTAHDYTCCKKCKAFFSNRTIRIHNKKCGKNKPNDRCNLIAGRRLTQYVHPIANLVVKTRIFPVLRNDDIMRSIQYDELIIRFANRLSEKYTSPHQHDMIRAQLRLLGRFKIEMKKQCKKVSELKDIFYSNLFDDCVVALRKVSNYDDELLYYKTPAVAQSLSTIINKCALLLDTDLIRTHGYELRTELSAFREMWKREIPILVSKKALEDQANQKRNKKDWMPSREDIKKLFDFLTKKCAGCIQQLCEQFSKHVWIELVQTTLILIQIFNRRRAGEIERLTLSNYSNKEVVTDSVDKDILKNASKDTVALAKKYVRITLRGKLGRTVSVLLCPLCIKAIDLIIKYRSQAGITDGNDFIFASPGVSKLSKQYIRACPLLRQYSEECGAENPESLRGTRLRKHIATHTAMLNIAEASVEHLANFMGHHKDIHKSIYRAPLPVTEITCVSKLLMSAIGDEGDDDEDDDDDEIEIVEQNSENGRNNERNTEIECEDGDFNSSSTRKRRSKSPYRKTKRVRWTDAEKKALNKEFGSLKKLPKLPSLSECLSASRQHPALKRRTPEQIKTYIDNQRRYN